MMIFKLLMMVSVSKKIFRLVGIWFFSNVMIFSVKVMLVVVGIVYFWWVILLVLLNSK